MNNFNQFLSMGGYGVFVWPAYGITFAILLLNTVLPLIHKKQLLRELALKQSLQQTRINNQQSTTKQ